MEISYYVVKKGDSLWGIAKHFKVDIDQLAAYNKLSGKKREIIHVGQKIYLPTATAAAAPDVKLHIHLRGLSEKPLKITNVRFNFDGKTAQAQTDENGWIYDLEVFDHAKGLHISFENYACSWQTIFKEDALPLGEKVLRINVLTDLVKGQTYKKEGNVVIAEKRIGKEIEKQTPQPAKPTTTSKQLKEVPAEPIAIETRTKNGQPATVIAPLFADENLYLPPGNQKYRKIIIASAKKYNFTPHAFAAIINAEAALKKDGTWIETSGSSGSGAKGLGQFVPVSWYQYIAKTGTMGNAAALELIGAKKLHAESGKLFKVEDKQKTEITGSTLEKILSWRDNGEYSIDAIGSYAEDNLAALKRKEIHCDHLPPDEKAKIVYIMHHEGPENGLIYLKGKLGRTQSSTVGKVGQLLINEAKNPAGDVAKMLAKQFKDRSTDGSAEAKALADRFDGDYVKAYYYFLANHTDTKVRTKNFMLKNDGFNERSAFDVLKVATGLNVEKPRAILASASTAEASKPPPVAQTEPKASSPKPSAQGKPEPKARQSNSPDSTLAKTTPPASKEKEVEPNTAVGGDANWCDPLDLCRIRIGGYKCSVTNPAFARAQSSFGKRGARPHRGIDLCAVPGTAIKAVANGSVSYAGSGGTYGNIILIAVDINNLPPKQKRYAASIPDIEDKLIYFMYAHLSEIYVKLNQKVAAAQIIGKTGSSGNAKGMIRVGSSSAVADGAHLHFEVRRSDSLAMGKGKWFDPLPFLTQYS